MGLDREKKKRVEVEKITRKIENDYRLTQEAICDLESNQKELEAQLAMKENEAVAISAKIDDEVFGKVRVSKQAKELIAKIDELEENLKVEMLHKAKTEKGIQILKRQLEEAGDRLDEAGGATANQVDQNRKREGDLAKLRRDLEENTLQHQAALHQYRKKHQDSIHEMSEQVDHLHKIKARAEKDKDAVKAECDEARHMMDQIAKDKLHAEKNVKVLEGTLADLSKQLSDLQSNLHEFDTSRKKLAVENAELIRQYEEAEAQYVSLSKLKLSLENQQADAKKVYDDESKEKAVLLGRYRNLDNDIHNLREQLDFSAEEKADLLRQLSRANAEAQMYRAKYESEGLVRSEELEAARLKLQARLEEAEQTIEQLSFKNNNLEKLKGRMAQEYDAMHMECERAQNSTAAAEKRQKNFEKCISEWKAKVDDLVHDVDASQQECRTYSTELFRVKACYDESLEHLDGVRRENKNLSDEIRDLMDQIGEGGRNIHDISKNARKLEIEKEELQCALEEAETALEAEENKVLKGQLELSQVRQEIDRRIHEKEEEFENTRKVHQRAIENLQSSLEAEAKAKAETLRLKKKLESDINELEISIDHSNKANSDLQKSIKKIHIEVKELQDRAMEEEHLASEYREQLGIAERRANALHGELEESRTLLEP